MGGTTLHAGILSQWFEMLLQLHLKRYGRQWDFIWCDATYGRRRKRYRYFPITFFFLVPVYRTLCTCTIFTRPFFCSIRNLQPVLSKMFLSNVKVETTEEENHTIMAASFNVT